MSVLYSNSIIFVIPVYIFNGRKQTLVDTIGILSALRMRGLHDKRHLLAKLHICGSENCKLLAHFLFIIFKPDLRFKPSQNIELNPCTTEHIIKEMRLLTWITSKC